MIQITKEEAAAVRKKYKNTRIYHTVHKYYMEESNSAMRLVNELRTGCIVENHELRKERGK